METHYRREWRKYDWGMVLLVAALCAFGVLMVASAAVYGDAAANTAAAAKVYRSQYVWVGTGLLVLAVMSVIDFELIGRFWLVIYGVNIALLAAVLVFGRSGDYARWLSPESFGVPISFGIQPSEYAKIFMIVFLAKFLDKAGRRINNPLILLLALASAAAPILLIAVEPSLSASVVTLVILVTLLFAARISYKYVVLAVVILVPLLVFLYYDLHAEPHILLDKILSEGQLSRVTAMLYPDATDPALTFQTDQSMAAIAGGGMFGKGLFHNTVYIPYAYNDFIVAVVGAEFGFVGMAVLLAVMLAVVAKCVIHAWRTEIAFGRYLCVGVASMFAWQAFANVGVATGFLPNTGVVFPFISTGGSAMWVNMAAAGMVINVGMKKKKPFFE